jgi:hypothetical protein
VNFLCVNESNSWICCELNYVYDMCMLVICMILQDELVEKLVLIE